MRARCAIWPAGSRLFLREAPWSAARIAALDCLLRSTSPRGIQSGDTRRTPRRFAQCAKLKLRPNLLLSPRPPAFQADRQDRHARHPKRHHGPPRTQPRRRRRRSRTGLCLVLRRVPARSLEPHARRTPRPVWKTLARTHHSGTGITTETWLA